MTPARDRPVGLFNFDAAEQASLWLGLGPVEATRVLLAALRTALLLADEVVLDRNQVLDGIFFVAMSPDRLAWHLGLEPGAHLPITVHLLGPSNDYRSPEEHWRDELRFGPWSDSDPLKSWGIPGHQVELVLRNYLAVTTGGQRLSSIEAALSMGDSFRSKSVGPASEAWWQTDPVIFPGYRWEQRTSEDIAALIASARSSWVEAMLEGRIGIREPGLFRTNETDRELDVEKFVRLSLAGGAGAPSPCGDAERLASALVELRTTEGGYPTQRSLVARWLDGERVDRDICQRNGCAEQSCEHVLLEPAQMSDELLRLGETHHRMAFRWWSGAYYAAIAEREQMILLTLFNVDDVVGSSQSIAAEQSDWGLLLEPQSKLQRLSIALESMFSRRKAGLEGGRSFAIQGKIVERLRDMPPEEYASLRSHDVVQHSRIREDSRWWRRQESELFWDAKPRERRRRLRELAHNISERLSAYEIRRRRRGFALGSAVLLAIAAVLELGSDQSWWGGQGWTTLGLAIALTLVAMPWDRIKELWMGRSRHLEATVRISDIEHPGSVGARRRE